MNSAFATTSPTHKIINRAARRMDSALFRENLFDFAIRPAELSELINELRVRLQTGGGPPVGKGIENAFYLLVVHHRFSRPVPNFLNWVPDKHRMPAGQAPDNGRTSAGQDAEARGGQLAKAILSRRLRDGVCLMTSSQCASIRPDHSTLRTEIDVIRGPGSVPNRSALTGSRSRLTRWLDRS